MASNDVCEIPSKSSSFISSGSGSNRTGADLIALSLVWILTIIIVNPIGEFPLGDDWAYAKTVQRLLDTGIYHPSIWDEVTLVSHVMWGALFCLPFGFSFTALRFATLALGLAGIWVTYLLMKACNAPRGLALVGALLMAANPFYVMLSNTFMTDISFLTWELLAILFFVYTLENNSAFSFVVAVFFSVLAILCRQPGILPPVAFAVAYPLRYGVDRRSLGKSALPAAFGLGAYIAFTTFMDYTHVKSPLFQVNTPHIIQELREPITTLKNALFASQEMSVYLGLFLLPLLLIVPGRFKKGTSIALLGSLAVSGMFLANEIRFLLHEQRLMPLMDNTVGKEGVVVGIIHTGPDLPVAFWLTVTALGVLGGALLLFHLTPVISSLARDLYFSRKDSGVAARLFLLMTGALYYAAIMLLSPARDRHLLPLVPLLAALVVSRRTPQQAGVRIESPLPRKPDRFSSEKASGAILLMIGFFCFGAGSTRDGLALNRVRWQLLTRLLNDSHVPVDRVNGGFEFDGWYFFDEPAKPGNDQADVTKNVDPSSLVASVVLKAGNDYAVTMKPITGYDVFSRRTVTRWIPPSQSDIFILKRTAAAPHAPEPIQDPKPSAPPGP